MKNIGCKIASQSRLLTGVLTDTKRWNGGGDASFDSNRSGKSVACTLGLEPKGLAESSSEFSVVRIKTDDAIGK
jgi:hypothetical protein